MISLFFGENQFEIERAVAAVARDLGQEPEKFDGVSLRPEQLSDIFLGLSLFAEKRLIIIKSLSENTAIWNILPDWIDKLSPDTDIVLVEGKLDKRTATFKALNNLPETKEFILKSEKDINQLTDWLLSQAAANNIELDRGLAKSLINRVGFDQQALHNALIMLSNAEGIDANLIEALFEAKPSENVFNLFETALKGDQVGLRKMLDKLSLEDPYRVFGLLTSQLVQLVAVSLNSNQSEVASDLGVHPYGLKKLAPVAKKMNQAKLRNLIQIFADTDLGLKTSSAEPWLLVERALFKTATL